MRLFIFFLISLSKQAVDWPSHIIKPVFISIGLEEDKVSLIFLLNKFEDTLRKEKLHLLV